MNEAILFLIAASIQAICIGLLWTKGQGRLKFELELSFRKDRDNGHIVAKLDKGD